LQLTDKGQALEQALTENQRRRFARAYRQAGADAVEGFRQVLLGLIEEPPDEYLIQGDRRLARM
jgi:DNA-binding MarR family transcriptional regulator